MTGGLLEDGIFHLAELAFADEIKILAEPEAIDITAESGDIGKRT